MARRFLVKVEAAFHRLASRPGIGTRREADNPAFGEPRYFPLASRFKQFLVFYRPTSDGIEGARVLHGARDIGAILGEDLDLDDEDGATPGPGRTEDDDNSGPQT